VGAGLVLGAGGAAMMVFGRGHRADSAARLDTMRAGPPPVVVDSTSRAAVPPAPPPRAADSRTARRPSGRDAGATRRTPPPPPTVAVSELQVRRTLESTALDLAAGNVPAKAARDTAEFYYMMPTLPNVYRAAAAKIICDSYMAENSRSRALTWCQRALLIAPDNTTYQKLVRLLKGDSQP
jgi:hypothetical protein